MLPITHHDHRSWVFRVKTKINDWIRLILSDRSSKNLLLFLLLNLTFAFIELFYGIATNSLGLISDSFHMFFDCSGLMAGLVASVITKWRATDKYSYGYGKTEVLAGFANSLLLLFISFLIFAEAVERLIEPPEVHGHERLFVVSVLGFIVNLIGIYAFGHVHSHGGGSHGHSHGGGSHGHSHGDDEQLMSVNSHSHSHSNSHSHSHDSHSHNNNHGHSHNEFHAHSSSPMSGNSQIMRGVFLHILADTLGSVGVIFSAGLMYMFGWMRADPICSLFIAILIAASVLGLIKESAQILIMRQPEALDGSLPQCYQRISGLAGVYSVQEPHFWTLSSNAYVGSIKLEVSENADAKYVKSQAQSIFEAIGVKHMNIQLDHV